MDNNFWNIEYKLPKGFKWKDGEKHKFVKEIYGGKKYWHTIILLEVNNDLYIKGVVRKRDKNITPIAVISNWRNVSVHNIQIMLNNSPFLCNILLKYYREHGVYCGLMVPILRDINSCVKQENV